MTVGDTLYFLTARSLWKIDHAGEVLRHEGPFIVHESPPPSNFAGVPLQELCNFTYIPESGSIIVLDKSGDLYEYYPKNSKWRLFRNNLPFLSNQPDPHFIDLCHFKEGVALLDPERNQIWKCDGPKRTLPGFFPDLMPWRVKAGDAILGDASAIASDTNVYVIRGNGVVTIYSDGNGTKSPQSVFSFNRPKGMRPSRLATAQGAPLYVVERENNRVLAIDKNSHRVSQFHFPSNSDLRGLLPAYEGFWIINNGCFEHRTLSQADKPLTGFNRRHLDSRLDNMIMPIEGMRLPRHSGVFPGARRLYRYGVHEGLDLFYDSGAKTKVRIGTPVVAAKRGDVVRADANYSEMTAPQFNRVMAECYRQHRTSAHNEDLLRGCQVWIDHGHGLMTRYAHLSKIKSGLTSDEQIETGALLGYVGISGTGQNLPGRIPFPHLHYEIWPGR